MSPDFYTVLDEKSDGQGTTIQTLEIQQLRGGLDPRLASMIHFSERTGITVSMVRIKLENSAVRIEPGALYFMKGDLAMQTSMGGGLMKGLGRKLFTGENMFVNEISGTGEIYLEPTFGHFMIIDMAQHAKGLIADHGMFFAGSKGLEISAERNKRIGAMIAGGEGWFQTKMKGEGLSVLFSKVPASEIQEFELTGDKLSVDGNFALLRDADIEFKVEKSAKTWIGTSVSGEGLLQTFTGHGKVWIAPTQGIYDRLATHDGIEQLIGEPLRRNTKT